MNTISPDLIQNLSPNTRPKGGVSLHNAKITTAPAFGNSFISKLELFNDIYQKSKNRKIVKNVQIKDVSGKVNNAVIIKTSDPKDVLLEDCSLYEMYINGLKTGHITFSNKANDDGEIFVYGLAADYENSKNYKGMGTELLKLAAEHSINEGCNGKIHLFADFVPEPTQFYYKSNFRVSPKCSYVEHSELEGVLDYSIRHNIKSNNFKNFPNAIPMSLDEKGAGAFLSGERLYEDTNSKTLYSTILETKHGRIKADVDFCDFTDRKENPCYLIQIISKKVSKDDPGNIAYEQIASMELALSENNTCEINKINTKTKDEKLNQNLKKELYTAAIAAQKITTVA